LILSLAARAQQRPASAPGPAAAEAPANETKVQDDQQAGSEPARQQPPRRPMALAQYLNLTESQKWQFVQIQKQAAQNVWAARKDESLNEDQMQKKLKEIHAEQRRQLLALLTTDQQDALKKWWEDQRQKQRDKSPNDASQAASLDKDKTSDDDFFAGMVQDPDPPARPAEAHNKPASPK
jgi:hypothetical protein